MGDFTCSVADYRHHEGQMKKQTLKAAQQPRRVIFLNFPGIFECRFSIDTVSILFVLSEAINNFQAAYLTKLSNSKPSTRKNSEIEIT